MVLKIQTLVRGTNPDATKQFVWLMRVGTVLIFALFQVCSILVINATFFIVV